MYINKMEEDIQNYEELDKLHREQYKGLIGFIRNLMTIFFV
jgi:hypothetical protein